MAYTTIDKPEDYFNIVTYTGNNTNNRSITGLGFQPDLTWIKMRQSQTSDHALFDSNRGTNNKLASNTTAAEVSPSQYGGVGSFDSDGFTLVNGTTQVLSSYMFEVNKSSETYVAWNWKANGGTTSSNTDGSITSTVQANTDAGFSIVTYSGNSTSGATIGHGLGVAPNFIIVKSYDLAGNWMVGSTALDSTLANRCILNSTAAASSNTGDFNAAPTSSVFQLGNSLDVNSSTKTYVAYCFAEKQGFSKFGSYVSNGNANGPFVYTGFKPAFVIIKSADTAKPWVMKTAAISENPINEKLHPNLSSAEGSDGLIDFVSNGFKVREGPDANINNSLNSTYIYMAFAENPFVTSTGISTTAR